MSRLTWDDLLIQNIQAEECREWLAPWSWLVEGQLYPEFLNRFGSWFLRRPEGHVDMLDVLNGTIEKVADNHDQFLAEVNEPSWQEINLLSELVYELHQHDKVPGPRQCYALAPHPAVGGPNPTAGQKVDLRFVMITDIRVWQSLCSQFLHGAG